MKSARRRGSKAKKLQLNEHFFTLSKAKTYLGRLVQKAMKGEAVYIVSRHHRFVLQEVPEIEPIPMCPPGYFANCYTQGEIREDNRLAKSSVIRPPKDLE